MVTCNHRLFVALRSVYRLGNDSGKRQIRFVGNIQSPVLPGCVGMYIGILNPLFSSPPSNVSSSLLFRRQLVDFGEDVVLVETSKVAQGYPGFHVGSIINIVNSSGNGIVLLKKVRIQSAC